MALIFYHPESDDTFVAQPQHMDITDADHVFEVAPHEIPYGTKIKSMGAYPSTVCASMDFETYSEAGYIVDRVNKTVKGIGTQGKGGLPAVGTPVYAEHPSTEVLCLYYDLKDGKGRRGFMPGLTPDPVDLIEHVRRGGMVEAWNYTFEFWIWNMICARRYGWPPLSFDQGVCVMARARRFSLPGSLETASQVLGLDGKQKDGKTLIQQLTRPHKPTKARPEFRRLPWTHPDEFKRFYSYCDGDVLAEDLAAAHIPDLTEYERATWLVDQRINARGVLVDRQTLDRCLHLYNEAEKRLTLELGRITGGAVGSVGETAKMLEWLNGYGLNMPDLTADTVEERLDRIDKSVGIMSGQLQDFNPVDYDVAPKFAQFRGGKVERVLQIRKALAGANIKKLFSLDRSLSSDHRLRDQYMYCGADQTGRWSAGGVQLQNLTAKGPKTRCCSDCGRYFGDGVYTLEHLNACPECGSSNTPTTDWLIDPMVAAIDDINRYYDKPDLLSGLWPDAVELITGCLRGLFKAGEGKRLICCDFSAIEAVVLACLSGCQWRIDVFATHGKIYEMSAAAITGKTLEYYLEYKKQNGTHHADRKKIGKVAELACFTRDTQVLTKRGYVCIVDVTKDDQLWDGVEWVKSEGAIHKGEREVINLDGIEVTPNHPINLNGFWKEANQLVSNRNLMRRALATGSANLPSFAKTAHRAKGARKWYAVADTVRTSLRCLTYIAERVRAVLSVAVESLATHTLKNITAMPTSCPTTSTVDACATGYPRRSDVATIEKTRAFRTTADAACQCPTNGATIKGRFCVTSKRSKGGTTPRSTWTGSTLTEITNPETLGLSRDPRTTTTSDQSSKCKPESMNLKDVYDIVNAGPRHRFTIKTNSGHMIVHNSGYGGWIGAWKAFGATQNDDELKQLIIKWREASPEIVEFWGGQFRQVGPKPWDAVPELFGLEGAFIAAVQNPRNYYDVGPITMAYEPKHDILYLRLPSGRFLHYHRPRLHPAGDRLKRGPCVSITFEGYNTNSQKGPIGWITKDTYGGRLAENVTQAVAADIQAEALVRVERAGYPVVMHTHDEIISEVEHGRGSWQQMAAIMSERPAWASWWPIKADGWQGERYRKD